MMERYVKKNRYIILLWRYLVWHFRWVFCRAFTVTHAKDDFVVALDNNAVVTVNTFTLL